MYNELRLLGALEKLSRLLKNFNVFMAYLLYPIKTSQIDFKSVISPSSRFNLSYSEELIFFSFPVSLRGSGLTLCSTETINSGQPKISNLLHIRIWRGLCAVGDKRFSAPLEVFKW
jgi:hypothetical protein